MLTLTLTVMAMTMRMGIRWLANARTVMRTM